MQKHMELKPKRSNPMPKESPDDIIADTFRYPRRVQDGLKAKYRSTYPAHGLSWNAWIVRKLERWSKPRKAAEKEKKQ
mgnify:FL=1